MRLEGKVAIITGGASGFGAGIAEKFAQEGARIIIADVNKDAAAAVAERLGHHVTSYAVDVTSDENIQSLVKFALDEFGSLDILVNNAGITHLPSPLEEVSEEEFDRVFAVNAKSVFLASRQVVPVMKKQGHGTILNIASTGAVSPRPQLTWYNASKGWMNTATRGMAVELAPLGIRVNALNPVAGETPLLKSFMGEDTPQMREKFLATIPIGRFSTPQDIANAASYLCSEEASMITGVCLEVDGGRCI